MYWISITGNSKTTPIANAPTGFRWQKKTSKEISRPIPFPGFFGWTYGSVNILTKPWINLHLPKSYVTWCFRVFPGSNLFGWKTILTNKKKHPWLHPKMFFFPWWKTPFFGFHQFFSCWRNPHPNSWKSQLSFINIHCLMQLVPWDAAAMKLMFTLHWCNLTVILAVIITASLGTENGKYAASDGWRLRGEENETSGQS